MIPSVAATAFCRGGGGTSVSLISPGADDVVRVVVIKIRPERFTSIDQRGVTFLVGQD